MCKGWNQILKKIKTDDSSDDKSSVKNFRIGLAANKTYPKVDVIMKGHRKSADAVQISSVAADLVLYITKLIPKRLTIK